MERVQAVEQLLVTSAAPRGSSRRYRYTACAARHQIETSREDLPHLEDPVLDPERADAVGSDQDPVRTARQHPLAAACCALRLPQLASPPRRSIASSISFLAGHSASVMLNITVSRTKPSPSVRCRRSTP